MVWWDQYKLIWFRWCQACVAATRWRVQRQLCLAYSQAWWWECHGLGLHECCRHWGATIHWGNQGMPGCTGHTEAEHDPLPFGDWAAGQYSNMIMTTALLRGKVMVWQSMSPDLNPIEHLWGILKLKVEERKVSNIHQLCDVVMEEWKRTPVATCEALVNSMPKRVKAVLENHGGHTKYGHFGPNLDIFT